MLFLLLCSVVEFPSSSHFQYPLLVFRHAQNLASAAAAAALVAVDFSIDKPVKKKVIYTQITQLISFFLKSKR